jgi:hypothetical protein
MSPAASGAGGKKYWLQDHDTDEVNEAPPVINVWYTAFDAEDVRLIWCAITQHNDESAAKEIQVRWTIDGQVYWVADSVDSDAIKYVYRNREPSLAGTQGLVVSTSTYNAAYYVDKRGLDFKVEVRLTDAAGTNQTLICDCVRETLEET